MSHRSALLDEIRLSAHARRLALNPEIAPIGDDVQDAPPAGGATELGSLRASGLVSAPARLAFRDRLTRALQVRLGGGTDEPMAEPEPPSPDSRAGALADDLDSLVENAVVQHLLESEFRSQLEDVVSRRASEAMGRLGRRRDALPTRPPPPPPPPVTAAMRARAAGAVTGRTAPRAESSAELEQIARRMERLERMVAASFELQLEVQRIVKQEVAAALAFSDARTGQELQEDSKAGTAARARAGPPRAPDSNPRLGACIICLDHAADCAFQSCGHMCYCMQCAYVSHERGERNCPVCRAPVRDRLRCFPQGTELTG